MSLDISLMESRLGQELRGIGFHDAEVQVVNLDSTGTSCLVTIVSSKFEGQTFLDREMRIRPVVARVLAGLGNIRQNYVVEALTPEEDEDELSDAIEVPSTGDNAEGIDERRNRKAWKEQKEALRAALRSSGYELDNLVDGSLFVARRSQLSSESILVGLSISTNAKTVDLDTHRRMEAEWKAKKHSTAYYVSPSDLQAPFANQNPAPWLTVLRGTAFLHVLNGSTRVARKLLAEQEQRLNEMSAELRGPIIDPDVCAPEGESATTGFMLAVKQWLEQPKASMLVLMASAGHGKTTLASHLTYVMAKTFLETNGESPLPLLVPFEAVRRVVDFESLVHKRLGELLGGSYGTFRELLRLRQAVLLVDGFDELADDAGFEVAESQVRSMSWLVQGRAKILLAGRSVFTRQFAGSQSIEERIRALIGNAVVQTLEIQPFGPEHIDEYIATRESLSVQNRKELLDFVSATADHADLCSNPLFLRFLVTLAVNGRLPSQSKIDIGVDVIVAAICEREEERQHLSLGGERQIEFLSWIAYELFRTGKPWLPTSDVEVMASAIAGEALAEKLTGPRLIAHALLRQASSAGIGFIHPFIRDVLLGHYALAQMKTGPGGRFRSDILEQRDLPEGTIQYLARQFSAFCTILPNGWLSGGGDVRSAGRRNLFRVLMADVLRSLDDPAEWLNPAWILNQRLVSLEFSSMLLEGRSFNGITFDQCMFENAYLAECDLRGTVFVRSMLASTSLVNCATDTCVRVVDCSVARVVVRNNSDVSVAESGEELARLLVGEINDEVQADTSGQGARRRQAAFRAHSMVREVLALFVSTPPPEFHKRRRPEVPAARVDHHEQLAIDRVIIPQVLAKLCDRELAAKSVEVFTLTKRWRAAAIEYVRDGRLSGSFKDAIVRIVARATRYL